MGQSEIVVLSKSGRIEISKEGLNANFSFPENEDAFKIGLMCPGRGIDHLIIEKFDDVIASLSSIWMTIAAKFQSCPHLFNGRVLNVVSRGNNPHMSNDITKKIIYGADGIPLGSNGGISKVLSKAFGSRLHMTVTSSGYYFDNKTRKWSGVFSEVSKFHSNKNWLL